MKASELRIGNIVSSEIKSGEHITMKTKGFITKIGLDEVVLNGKVENDGVTFPIETTRPIPLTDEVLLNCGFYNCNNSFFMERIGSLYFSKPYKECLWYNVKTDGGDKITTVTYLHQLQNLYFVITGQELEVKL